MPGGCPRRPASGQVRGSTPAARAGSPVGRVSRVLVLAFVVQRLARVVVLVRLGLLGLLGLGLHELDPAVVEDRHPLLDAGEGLRDLGLEGGQDLEGVFVRAGTDLIAGVAGLGDDAPALLLGELQEAPLPDEEGGLLLGPADDPGCLLLGLLDDPLALRVDPLRGADLLGDRDPQLVDEIEDGVPVDDDVAGQGQ